MKKIIILPFVFMAFTGCSSLVTRGDLRDCQKKCASKGIEHCSKSSGKMTCECKG